MRWSKTFIPTVKEVPAEAEIISHKLMLRAGMIRMLSAGLYIYLPLGLKVIRKVEDIIRCEINEKGAQELLMPILQPRELWERSGRWNAEELGMLTVENRTGREFVLAPTHEEVITDLVRKEIKSYRDLPKNFYQIQTKFRDELRPRFGLMRAKEFIMKDSYSFDVDEESAGKTYRGMEEAYRNIFARCGLQTQVVKADPGAMGGGMSHEFMAVADVGEDIIVLCRKCDYAANKEAVADISSAKEGKPCPECGGPLSIGHGIEVGQIFNLGTKYSKSMGAAFLDADGEEKLCVMGCFGIGVTRTVSAIVEQNHDENGIIWPPGVSPYRTLILPVNINDAPSRDLTEKTYEELLNGGVEVLVDDRDVRAGIKFKDADLIGIPIRITIGPDKAKSGMLEIKNRRTGEQIDCLEKDLMPELNKLLPD
jgi:prolyl-tRNA synthetase